MAVTAYLGLGSNLGDRRDFLETALQALRVTPGIVVTKVSEFIETAPVGGPPGQGPYLNAAAEVRTELGPVPLLRRMQEIEHQLGRVRGERWGPRTIDLDLLLYGNECVSEPDLQVPHPEMARREFVLRPLTWIAPEAVHPVLGRTIRRLLQDVTGRELAGLRALVTGSTSGIGLAIADALARGGADVIVHGRRSRSRADALSQTLSELGVRSQVILADLRRADDGMTLVNAAWRAWDGLDVWVNNAGADTLTGEAADWPFERKLEELLAVDLKATILLSREVGRRMKEQGGGVIVNIGWDQAETGMEGDSGELFAATKGAIMCFSRSLALSLAPEVRVNCLAPGWIKTSWGEQASDDWQSRAVSEAPLARWGSPDDVAHAARFLVSPDASFLTGQTYRINGGAIR
jgi:3-oxoacyl-[acyl-carrier protein] reductase